MKFSQMWLFGTLAIGSVIAGWARTSYSGETGSRRQLASAAQSVLDNGHRCLRSPADTPDALQPPADECVAAEAAGSGVQIYDCTGGAWVLKAPEANLLDQWGRFMGNHFLGPTWQWRDGSKIKASKVAQVAGADPTQDIPWLLLAVTSEDGEGRLNGIKHVQRLHTEGGGAPAGSCTEGAEVRIDYQAEYIFYR